MTPLPSVESLIAVVRADAPSQDPLELLAEASRSVAEMEQVGDALLDHFVEACRAGGLSWSEISSALGVSKQAAHKRFATATPTFERFTLRARHVLGDAVEQARRLGQSSVGTEHLLLALFSPLEALAAQVLHEAGVRSSAVEAELAGAGAGGGAGGAAGGGAGGAGAGGGAGTGAGSGGGAQPGGEPISGQIGYAPAARTALRNAVDEALGLGHNYVGTEHLLLALFDEPGGVAARILVSLGLTRSEAERRVGEKFAALKSGRAGPQLAG
jgi:ATP-dependent Clp protease ATP-binding subunit ClpA